MDKRKLQAVINRIKSDKDGMRFTLNKLIKERGQLDDDILYDQYGTEVVDGEVCGLDIEIGEITGYIDCSVSVIKKLDMLMESINK